MKKLRFLLFALATLTLAACGSDGNELTERNIFTEKDKANDLYELVTDVAFAVSGPESIVECHLDTTYIYNYSQSAVMPVTYTMFGDLKDTLSITITEGSEYVSQLNLQGDIRFPSSIADGKPCFNKEMPILMPIRQSQAFVDSNILYSSTATLAPRTFLKYTGTYHCIVSSCTFTAYYIGQNTGERICVKGTFRHSQPTVASIDGSTSAFAEIHPME